MPAKLPSLKDYSSGNVKTFLMFHRLDGFSILVFCKMKMIVEKFLSVLMHTMNEPKMLNAGRSGKCGLTTISRTVL